MSFAGKSTDSTAAVVAAHNLRIADTDRKVKFACEEEVVGSHIGLATVAREVRIDCVQMSFLEAFFGHLVAPPEEEHCTVHEDRPGAVR